MSHDPMAEFPPDEVCVAPGCGLTLEEHTESPISGIAWCPSNRTEFTPAED